MKIKSIFVLGSTSLIAQELCIELAKKGCSRFHLISRDSIKNKPLKETLIKKYNASVTEEFILPKTQDNQVRCFSEHTINLKNGKKLKKEMDPKFIFTSDLAERYRIN
tara:strand:+ start:409 stop:732 length:324 start_codon:yes stop_codon:yes gene_type:complete